MIITPKLGLNWKTTLSTRRIKIGVKVKVRAKGWKS